MNRQQAMFVETHGPVLNRLQASLFNIHADWQILFMADALAALDLITQQKVGIVLANFGMDNAGCGEFFRRLRKTAPDVIRIGLLPDQVKMNIVKSVEYTHEYIAGQGSELTDTEEQADTPSMFDGLVQRKPLTDKLVEQGLIHPHPHPRDPVTP